MRESLKKNLNIKIISVLLAIGIWFFVLDSDNPIKVRDMTIPLKIENENTLLDKGLVLKNKDYQKSIEIKVRGRKEIIDNLSTDDFRAVLDFSKVKDASEKQVVVDGPSYIGKDREDVKIDSGRYQAVSIELEKTGNNTFQVAIAKEGSVKEGYKIVKTWVTPDSITIDGTDSLVKSIASIETGIDVDGLEEDTEFKKIECKVIGKNGKEVNLNKKYTVDIKVEIAREVPIVPVINGKPAKNYIKGTYKITPEKALITGPHDILAKTYELTTLEPIDIENASNSVDVSRIIKLPAGIKLVNTPQEVEVSVAIEPLAQKDILIAKDNITLLNTEIDNSLKYEIQAEGITVTVKGSRQALEQLDASMLNPRLDVGRLGEGVHKVPLQVDLPDNVKLAQDYNVDVKIEKR